MKTNFLPFLIIILTSCNISNEPKEIDYSGFSEKQVVLKTYNLDNELNDTLCTIFIQIPLKLDTFYHWIDFSDYTEGQFVYYRFADSNYSVYRDVSGFRFSPDKFPDSLYQISIRYKPFKEIPDSIMRKVKIDTNDLGYKLPNPKFFTGWIKKEKRNINGNDFVILAYHDETWLKNIPFKIVIKAHTYFKNRPLEIVGECDGKDTTGFIDTIYKSFLSIRIKENP